MRLAMLQRGNMIGKLSEGKEALDLISRLFSNLISNYNNVDEFLLTGEGAR